jgi:hypothetical protein
MALSPNLLQFKSSGVYRLEFDKSQTANINVETLRLITGHSRKGPYNSPVLISSVEDFTNVFGTIDKKLEKKGMFFHRSALEALSRGPILALNLSKFTSASKSAFAKPVSNGNTVGSDEAPVNALASNGTSDYTSFFDNDKFMVPSDSKVLSALENKGSDNANAINFVNIKQSAVTVFIRKAASVKAFDINARDWYGEGNVPEFMNDFDYISDFMVDVFVFKGNFSDVSADPVYGAYFNEDGLDKSKLAEFANLRQVTLEAQYTGSLIPGFKDLEGRSLYVETMVNAEARKTGLFCAIDEDAVINEEGTELDLVGHKVSTGNTQLLSYKINAGDREVAGALDGVNTTGVYTSNGSQFSVDFGTEENTPATFAISAGNYVKSAVTDRLAKVKRVSKAGAIYNVYCDVAVELTFSDKFFKSFEAASTHYAPFALPGATLEDQTISTALDALKGGTGLHAGLIDKDLIDFRYVVDTFTSNDGELQNKHQLSDLAQARQNASAILNAPTVADFKKSVSPNPSFTNAAGEFKVEYIAQGGNLDKNPTSTYSLPSILEGANYAFYYGPGLLVSDGGKDIIVPPAAYVSNNFIDKYTSAQPWSIVAGPRRGVVGGSGLKGVEYAFDKNDRDVLEPFGINPIVFQRGVGLTILGNKTAQQSVKSSLSSAHVREALIFIQEGIADILKGYVFEFNNVQTRLEIKTLADSFMESVKADGGVFEFKNIMDQTNNTDEVIDNNFGIIDTYVEPVKGLEVVVHRTTVLNTGEISTGNFS